MHPENKGTSGNTAQIKPPPINPLDYQSDKYAFKTPRNKGVFSREQGNK